MSRGDVWLRLPAAVWVHEQRHVWLRDGNLLLQHRLQRHPLWPGWERSWTMMTMSVWSCFSLLVYVKWNNKMSAEHACTLFLEMKKMTIEYWKCFYKIKLQSVVWWTNISAVFIHFIVCEIFFCTNFHSDPSSSCGDISAEIIPGTIFLLCYFIMLLWYYQLIISLEQTQPDELYQQRGIVCHKFKLSNRDMIRFTNI